MPHRPVRRAICWAVTGVIAVVAPSVLTSPAHAATSDLLFSEYVEGTNYNKALEIYNGTGARVDLSGYTVQLFVNGGTTASWAIPLSGSLASGDVHVMAHPDADASVVAAADQTSANVIFNGDDAVTLRRGTSVVDSIGQIGFDPGAQWGTGLVSTENNTIRRRNTICSGRTAATTAFNPATEWEGYATDTLDGLGSHTAQCGDTPPNDAAPSVTSITPATGASDVPTDTSVSVVFSEPVTLTDGAVTLTCDTAEVAGTITGSGTTYTFTPAKPLPQGATCTTTILASMVADVDADDPPDTRAADVTSSFTVVSDADPCTAAYTPVAQIQGSGPSAALTGIRTTQGVVVGDYEGASPALRGFYLQDANPDGDPATSEGLFVFNGANTDSVRLGDIVRVTGTVAEYQGQTQLSVADSAITACGTGTVEPTDVTLPWADAEEPERYEGMLLRFPQELVVTEHFQLGRFGQVVVSSGERLWQPTNLVEPGPAALALQARNDLDRLVVDDATQAQNPDPIAFSRNGGPLTAANTLRGGDTTTGATGVLTYTWGGNAASPNAYRLRPLQALDGDIDFVATNPRPGGPPSVGGSVQVAGMNLLNYFNTFGSGCRGGVSGPPMDCRGADNEAEFDRQRAKTVAAITLLDADVVGINEIENDGYSAGSAIAELVEALNAVAGAGTWAYVDADAGTGQVDALGDDAIKVGILYKAGVVTAVGTTAVLNTPEFVTGGDAMPRNRPSLAQAWKVTDTGAVFVTAVNHLKSKGSACETPDQGDGQGNCAIVRTNAARALTTWLGTDPTRIGDPDVVLLGDYNSYAKERPIQVLQDAGYVDLIDRFRGDDAYTYVFDGQWGYLDQALASPSMLGQVSGAAAYHINADEPSVLDYNTNFKTAGQVESLYAPDEFRVSDHDPVLIGLTPNAAPTLSAGGPYVVDEGGSVQLTAKGTDTGDELTYAWDLDGDGTFETAGSTVDFDASALDGPTTAVVTVRVTDSGGLSDTATATVTVRNVAPTVTAEFVRPLVVCGQRNGTIRVRLTDPAPADTHRVTIDWGDGTSSTIGIARQVLVLRHTYTEAGRFEAGVSVVDDDGGASSAAATLTVAYRTAGLLAPLSGTSTHTVKAGSILPVRIRYADCNGFVPTGLDPSATVTRNGQVVARGTLAFRNGVWQWNLRTGALPSRSGTYVVTVTLPETGQASQATFRLRP